MTTRILGLQSVVIALVAGAVFCLAVAPTMAGNASANGAMAVATGPIDSDVEGFFTLDFRTGELQCFVFNTRTQQIGGRFRASVSTDLRLDVNTKPSYLLVTGYASFVRGAGVVRPANSIVYVTDTNSGNFAAYSVPWNSNLAKAAKPQVGNLVLLQVGSARPAAVPAP